MKLLAPLILLCISIASHGQRYMSEKSFVSFYSDAPVEDIEAKNNKSKGIFDASSGQIAFTVPIKDFIFEKPLMQEHFNEKYLESDRFPKSTFSGTVEGFDQNNSQEQKVNVKGKLMIHGVTKDVSVTGTIRKEGEKLVMKSKFKVRVEDYQVKIPQLLWQNIAEEVLVTVEFTFAKI